MLTKTLFWIRFYLRLTTKDLRLFLQRLAYLFPSEFFLRKNSEGKTVVKNPHALRRFEKALARKDTTSFNEACVIFEALWKEAVALGAIRERGWRREIEKEIRIARYINQHHSLACSKT